MPRVLLAIVPLITLVVPMGTAQVTVPAKFDGRVRLAVVERWTRPVPSPPVLMLELSTVQSFADAGHCLFARADSTGNSFTVALDSVATCRSGYADFASPAFYSVALPGLGRQLESLVLTIAFRSLVDRYHLSRNGGLVRVQPQEPLQLTTPPQSQYVVLVEPRGLYFTCAPLLMSSCICPAFLEITRQRAKLRISDAGPVSTSAFRPELPTDSLWFHREGGWALPDSVPFTRVLESAEEFTHLFDGQDTLYYYRSWVQIEIRTWLGQNFLCRSGRCTQEGH